MFEYARYRQAIRRALRAMPKHYGLHASLRVLDGLRRSVSDGVVSHQNAIELLNILIRGDLGAMADHPVFHAEHPELYCVEPDSTRIRYFDPRPGRELRAVDNLAKHALLASRKRDASEARAHVVRLWHAELSESFDKKVKEEQRLQARIQGLGRRRARGPDRLSPTRVRDVSALVAAARPGPLTGVVPVAA